MARIDAHQHFWQFDPVRDAWINDDMKLLQRDFLPGDLLPELLSQGIDGTIAVQADQSIRETELLLKLAGENEFIHGVVGWIDLQSDRLTEELEALRAHEKLRGFRHVLQSEPDERFMLRPAFQRGIGLLRNYDFTYDILIYPQHLPFALELVTKFPDQRFVVDHLAKPHIRDHRLQDWKKDIEAIAGFENVYCKVSGMVTEASCNEWTKADFEPYLDTVMEAFGTRRLMFGSDWPVCLVAASYGEVVDLVQSYISRLSADEQADCMGRNARLFYNLK